MSDLDPNSPPKFEQPSTPEPAAQQPRQVSVNVGALVIFKTANQDGTQQLVAGKLLGAEGDVLSIASEGNYYQAPLASIVHMLSDDNKGAPVILETSMCTKLLDAIEEGVTGLRKEVISCFESPSSKREFFSESAKAVISQRRLDVLKDLLKLINAL